VRENALIQIRDGKIARWEGFQAWDQSPTSLHTQRMESPMTSQTAIDPDRVQNFAGKVLGDLAGTMATALAILGDRLGLFVALADGRATTSTELAERAGVSERYAHEWLHGLHAAGYLEHDDEHGGFALPAEHAEVLATEGGPSFVGGGYQALSGELRVLDRLSEAFRSGGGVPQAAYPDDAFEGMRRFSAPWYEHQLIQQWIPALDGAHHKLQAGARYADVGCGAGHALIKLAQTYPRSSFVGYDAFQGAIDQARREIELAGLAHRVRLELLDAADGLPERYDLISTFDVVHDAIDPVGLLRAIRRALEPDGTYLMLEMRCADDPAQNVGPFGTLLYGISVLYCMTTSLAHGGAGLGTCGCPPEKVHELCDQAGFSSVRELEIENPFDVLYEITP
jgi:SAM-dependent methyltransferase